MSSAGLALAVLVGCGQAATPPREQARTGVGSAVPKPTAAAAGAEAPRKESTGARHTKLVRHLRQRRIPIEARDLERVIQTVDRAARRFGIDPLLVLALIHEESRFDPRAVSRAGCLGLMQLKVRTARDLAAGLNISWVSDDLLFDPEVNVLLGTCYLRQLLDRFRDPDLALAAFHSGPSRIVAQRLRAGPSSRAYAGRVRGVLLDLQACARA